MAIAELVMPKIRLVPQCYFCGKLVGDEQFCYGCCEFVCETCNEVECVGTHEVEDHRVKWEVEDD